MNGVWLYYITTLQVKKKANSFVRFFGESTVWQFSFEINWPLGQGPPITELQTVYFGKTPLQSRSIKLRMLHDLCFETVKITQFAGFFLRKEKGRGTFGVLFWNMRFVWLLVTKWKAYETERLFSLVLGHFGDPRSTYKLAECHFSLDCQIYFKYFRPSSKWPEM